jgi:hypothetical protein
MTGYVVDIYMLLLFAYVVVVCMLFLIENDENVQVCYECLNTSL